MATSPFMFIFLCLQISVNSEIYPETSTNTFNPHTSEITAILNHLNSSSFKVYNYKEATLLHAHTKADITELTLTVNVECINKYPDIPCTENVLTCHAFVRSAPEGSQVLNDVNCKPKPAIIVEEASYEPPTGPPQVNEAKSVALSNEAVSSEVNEPFVAVRKSVMPCLGCPFEVNPDAEGVDELVDLALEHVGSERENKQGLVKVLKVQQQVVSGVKYILVAELGPTVCSKLSTSDVTSCPLDPNSETTICEITYLQKPWISKAKHIISNNCTTSQEYVREDDKKSELSNEIDISGTPSKPPLSTPNFDHIAESGNLEMSPSRLTDLESQILLDIEESIPSKESVPEAVAPSVASVPEIEERFEIDPTSAVQEVVDGENTTPEVVTEITEDKVVTEIIEDKVVTEITEDKVVTERVEAKSKEQDSSEESKSSSEEDTRSKRSEESAESDETPKSTISELKIPNNSSEESAESAESTSNSTTPEETVETTEPPARKRRAIPQLEKISPDEKPLVKNLADFAAAALDNIDDDNHKRIILQILGAKKMVGDDGVYYHLIMRMGISRCLEDKPPNPYENCRDKLFENYTKICKVQVYVNDDFTTPKVVKSQCQNIKRDKNDSNRTNYSRFRRSSTNRGHIAGGLNEIDKDSERVTSLLREGLGHLNAQRNTNKHKSVEVISATSQVVAGSMVRIKTKIAETDCSKNDGKDLEDCNVRSGASPRECLIKVWEKPWENFKKFTITCEGDEKTYEAQATSRDKRQLRIRRSVGNSDEHVRGGQSEIDKNSARVTTLLLEGLNHLNAKRNTNKHKSIEVISATDQVVAGSLLRIRTKIAETDCSKNDGKDLQSCNVRSGATPKECLIKVWEKPWENFKRFTITCEGDEKKYEIQTTSRSKRSVGNNEEEQIVGGESEIDKNSARVTKLLREGLNHLNARRDTNKHKSVEVVSATKQVVAGSLLRITTKIAETDCSKNDGKDLQSCNVRSGATPKECLIKVWEKPWENFKRFTITCEGDEKKYEIQTTSRSKRSVGNNEEEQIVGGESEIDKNSARVTKLLREGLNHLNARRDTNKHKSVEVVSATKQVVAGSLLRITTKIAETDCSKNDGKDLQSCNVRSGATPKECLIKVWEKPWENFKRFTITCEGDEKKYEIQTTSRSKRSVGNNEEEQIVGGESEIDKNSARVTKLLREGLNHLNARRDTNKHKSVEVVSATKQVVAGSLLRITTKIAETDCSKNDGKDLEDCNVRSGATPKKCLIQVWEKPWQNFKKFTITCEGDEKTYEIRSTFRSKRQATGGEYVVSAGDERLLDEYLEESLSQLDAQSYQENKYKVDEILSINKQVVAGHVYRIKAKVVLTDCKKSLTSERRTCNTLDGAQPKLCSFKIFEALWIPNSRQITISCNDVKPEPLSEYPRNTELLGNDDPKVHFELFNHFIEKYDKKYTKKEFKYRFKVFSDNLYHIRLLNRYEQGTATYGITQFTDMTQLEFSKSLGLRTDLRNENEPPLAKAQIPDVEIPTEFDWRKKGAVTEVKNQEQCGSCWAFSVTGNVEGQYAIKHGKLLEFSEQELVDCDKEDQGCNGGLMDTAYRQIEKLGGLETEQDYPYDAEDETCHFNRTLARVQLSGAVNISHDEGDMAKWLVANGPISIAINANAMQFYFGGISHPFKFLCSPKNLDHGVLIVGYGVRTYPLFNKTLPYWTVKNSWGTSWGEQGYYRVYRGDGTCGLNQTPSSAIVV